MLYIIDFIIQRNGKSIILMCTRAHRDPPVTHNIIRMHIT